MEKKGSDHFRDILNPYGEKPNYGKIVCRRRLSKLNVFFSIILSVTIGVFPFFGRGSHGAVGPKAGRFGLCFARASWRVAVAAAESRAESWANCGRVDVPWGIRSDSTGQNWAPQVQGYMMSWYWVLSMIGWIISHSIDNISRLTKSAVCSQFNIWPLPE